MREKRIKTVQEKTQTFPELEKQAKKHSQQARYICKEELYMGLKSELIEKLIKGEHMPLGRTNSEFLETRE